MAEKKITKREVINSMLANEVIMANEMYAQYLKHELELLDKKAEKKGKSEKELAEQKVVLEKVVGAMTSIGGKGTVSEIQKADSELAELSNQKVVSLLKVLVADKVVVRTVEGRKAIFSLV